MIKSSGPTKLPSRKVLDQLHKSKMTISDYAKVTPIRTIEQAPVVQMMRLKVR